MMRQYTDVWRRSRSRGTFTPTRLRFALDGYLQRIMAAVDQASTLEGYDVFAAERRVVTVIRLRFEKAGNAF